MVRSTSDSTSSDGRWLGGLRIFDQLFRQSGQRRHSRAAVDRAPLQTQSIFRGNITMQAETDKLVVLVTKGIDSELSSVAFTIANGGLTAGLKVSMFLTSTAIDLVRTGGQRLTQVAPLRLPRRSDRGFPESRRRHLGLHAVRQVARLRAMPTCSTASSSSAPAPCTPKSRRALRRSRSDPGAIDKPSKINWQPLEETSHEQRTYHRRRPGRRRIAHAGARLG